MLWSKAAGDPKKVQHDDLVSAIDRNISSIPRHTLLFAAFGVGVVSTLGTRFVYARFFKRIPNSDWIFPDVYKKRRWIKGRVVSVGDADNFRVYHTPGFGWNWPVKFRSIPSTAKELKDQTLHIRMAGVDAPEAGHFGRVGQPYAEEALAWLKSQVDGKIVYCELVMRDQYGRVVAVPHLKPRFLPGFLATGRCISLEMLRAGWAVTYEQMNAEYGKWGKDAFLALEAEAKAARRGMWKDGLVGETPSEYKRRNAGAGDVAPAPRRMTSKATGWWGALRQRFLRW